MDFSFSPRLFESLTSFARYACHMTKLQRETIERTVTHQGSTRATRVTTAIIAFTRLSLKCWSFPQQDLAKNISRVI
jgi:hypothetical protein